MSMTAQVASLYRQARDKINSITDGMTNLEAGKIIAEYEAINEKIFDAQLEEIDTSRRPGQNNSISVSPTDLRFDAPVPHYLTREQRWSDRIERISDPMPELGAFLRSTVTGPKSDVEQRVLSEASNGAGLYTVPSILSAQLIDGLRAQSVAVRAGARTVPLTSSANYFARVASDPVPAWRAENAAMAGSDPTFDRVAFSPKYLACLVKVSVELLADSLNVNTALPALLTQAMALELDRAALVGDGSEDSPTGIYHQSGIQTVALNAALSSYAPFISARTKLLTANAGEPTAAILHPRDEGTLAGLVASGGDGQPLNRPPAIANLPLLATTSIPTNLGSGSPPDDSLAIMGNFASLWIGMRNDVQITILRERYLADNGQIGFLATLRADVQLEHAESFCIIEGIHFS